MSPIIIAAYYNDIDDILLISVDNTMQENFG